MIRILSLILLLAFAGSGKAQQVRIDLRADRLTLGEVLRELSSTYHLQFAYSSDLIDVKREVSVDLKQATLDETLRLLFDQSAIGFTIRGSQIILYRAEGHRYTISGHVRV